MTPLLFVPNNGAFPSKLASYLGGPARIILTGSAFDISKRFLDLSGGMASKMRWSLYVLSDPDKDKLARLAGEVAEAMKSGSGEHRIDVGPFSLAEVFAVARQRNLDLDLVAVFKPRRKELPGDDPLDARLLEAFRHFGGRASSGQLCAHVHVIAQRVRRRLTILQEKGLVSKDGVFYVLHGSLGESAEEAGQHLSVDSLPSAGEALEVSDEPAE